MDQPLVGSHPGEPQIRRGRPPKRPGAPPHRLPREHIAYIESLNFWQAVQFAGVIDRRLNTRADINWRLAPSRLDVFTRRTRLLNALGNWLRRTARAGEPVYVYARELGICGHEHFHLALHVPVSRYREFEAVIAKAVMADVEPELPVVRFPNDGKAVFCQPIRTGWLNLKRAVESYFLKEGDEDTVRQWVEPGHAEKANGGTVYGKRVGFSRAIGRAARQRHGWVATDETDFASKGANAGNRRTTRAVG